MQAITRLSGSSQRVTWPARAELPVALIATALLMVTGQDGGRLARIVGPGLPLVLACLWGANWVLTGSRPALPALFLPIALFVLSAGVGLWAAYDSSAAWGMVSMILGSVGLFWAIARVPTFDRVYLVLVFLGLLASFLTLYFLASRPWDQFPSKVPFLTDMGRQAAAILPDLSSERINPNWAGGMLAILLPLGFSSIELSLKGYGPGGRSRLAVALCGLCAGVTFLGLVLSASRGAWGSVLLMGFLWGVWRWSGKFSWQRRTPLFFGIIVVVGLSLALIVSAIWALGWPGAESLAARWEIMRFSLALARDYPFTGAGLTGYDMQLSLYVLLIPVGYVTYAHNMLIDLLIGQGLLGVLAYVWAVVAGLACAGRLFRRLDAPHAIVVEASLASLGVGLVHGLVDNVQYQGRGLLLLWVPLALLASIAGLSQPDSVSVVYRQAGLRPAQIGALVIGIGLIALLGANWRRVAGDVYANLGALEQARVELAAYDPLARPWRSLDEIRREEDLDRALVRLEQAIALNPAQVTARQRLAAIDLARQDDATAREHMETLWASGRRDSTTRLLLGDAMVAMGDKEAAARVVAGQPWAVYRLLNQAWGRYYEAGHWAQARDTWKTVLILEPENQQAAYWAQEADRRLIQD